VERKLHDRLYFFKDSGEWFARSREEGVRYGPIMAEYRRVIGTSTDDVAQGAVFAPFAGTEGYTPVAYAPYVLAEAIGALKFLFTLRPAPLRGLSIARTSRR
jgi:hypothetical protein